MPLEPHALQELNHLSGLALHAGERRDSLTRFRNGPNRLLLQRLTDLVLMIGQFAGRLVLTPGLPQGLQSAGSVGRDVALDGRARDTEDLRGLFTLRTTMQEPQGPQSASYGRIRMRLQLTPHDPLLVLRELDPQPRHAPPLFYAPMLVNKRRLERLRRPVIGRMQAVV